MASSLSDKGVQFVDGNVINSSATIPTTGTFTAGQVVISSAVGANVRLLGWKRLTTGAGHVLNTDWAEITSGITLGTAVATTSGTAIDFTGIPSWAKRVKVLLSGVSTNGTSEILVRLGNTTFVTTGYLSSSSTMGGVVATNLFTTAFSLTATGGVNAPSIFHQTFEFNLVDPATNRWLGFALGARSDTSATFTSAGTLVLSSALDQIRLTTAGGVNTFDAGTMNISWE